MLVIGLQRILDIYSITFCQIYMSYGIVSYGLCTVTYICWTCHVSYTLLFRHTYILRLSYDLLNIITCNISNMGAYCHITNIIYYMFASNYLCIFVHDTTIDLYIHMTHIPTCHMYDKVQPTLSRTAFCAIST